MLQKIFILVAVFGLVYADPISKGHARFSNDLDLSDFTEDTPDSRLKLLPGTASLIFNLISTVIGYKITALSVGIHIINWLVSNFLIIAVGAIATLGFCKITGKCSFDYEEYVPVSQFRSLITPERLDTAEKFLMTALEKYAKNRN